MKTDVFSGLLELSSPGFVSYWNGRLVTASNSATLMSLLFPSFVKVLTQ